MTSGLLRCCILVILSLAATSLGLSQSEVGTTSLNGTVSDPAGAVVPNAQVTAKSNTTGFTRQVETTGAGFYSLSGLPVGAYEISVTSSGFKPVRIPNVNLSVGAAATLNINLQVGSATAEVTVIGDAPVVETSRTVTS